MKSILLSIKPKWVEKILNGEKTIEVRKQFPKDYVGWVYIYCTMGELLQAHWGICNNGKDIHILYGRKCRDKDLSSPHTENGKVVARFYCDKVEEIINYGLARSSETMMKDILKKSCLTMEELNEYAPHKEYKENDYIYALHISQLEIFDRPRELSEFYCNYTHNDWKKGVKTNYIKEPNILMKKLTKAPKNCCYIEGDE